MPLFFQISVFATIKEDSSLQKSSLDSRVESSLRRSSLESARVRQNACRFSILDSRVESVETRLGTSLISSRACGLAGSGSARIHPYSKDATAVTALFTLLRRQNSEIGPEPEHVHPCPAPPPWFQWSAPHAPSPRPTRGRARQTRTRRNSKAEVSLSQWIVFAWTRPGRADTATSPRGPDSPGCCRRRSSPTRAPSSGSGSSPSCLSSLPRPRPVAPRPPPGQSWPCTWRGRWRPSYSSR